MIDEILQIPFKVSTLTLNELKTLGPVNTMLRLALRSDTPLYSLNRAVIVMALLKLHNCSNPHEPVKN